MRIPGTHNSRQLQATVRHAPRPRGYFWILVGGLAMCLVLEAVNLFVKNRTPDPSTGSSEHNPDDLSDERVSSDSQG